MKGNRFWHLSLKYVSPYHDCFAFIGPGVLRPHLSPMKHSPVKLSKELGVFHTHCSWSQFFIRTPLIILASAPAARNQP